MRPIMARSNAICGGWRIIRTCQNYLREIYQWPGIRETARIDHIKRGYYSIAHINPTKVVPLGPLLDLDRPHDRDRLSGQGVMAV